MKRGRSARDEVHLVAVGDNLFSDQRGGAQLAQSELLALHTVELLVDADQLVKTVEGGKLRGELLIVERLERILILQLRDQELQEVIPRHPLSGTYLTRSPLLRRLIDSLYVHLATSLLSVVRISYFVSRIPYFAFFILHFAFCIFFMPTRLLHRRRAAPDDLL